MPTAPILLIGLLLFSCSPDSTPTALPESEEISTVRYAEIDGVDPNLLSLDVYHESPAVSSRPVVIYVHGGGWQIGDKANQIDNKVRLFRQVDYVFVSTNYRLGGNGQGADQVKFPIHNQDVATAIRWVTDNIEDYGGDPDRIVLLGHSAGGHLVALTGTNERFLEEVGLSLSNLRGVAAIDTEGYDVGLKVREGNRIYTSAFGTDAEVHRNASPIYNVEAGKGIPKFFVAKRGLPARVEIADRFLDSLRDNGVDTYEVDGSGYTHQGINEAIGREGESVVTPGLVEFLGVCFE